MVACCCFGMVLWQEEHLPPLKCSHAALSPILLGLEGLGDFS